MTESLALLDADLRVTWTRDVLRYGDTDANGHINNSTFSVLCESGRVTLFRERVTPHLPPDAFVVIVRLVIEYKAELFYPGEVRTATWVSAVGRTSMTVKQALFSGETLVATGEGVCVLMDGASRRPLALPPAVREALAGAMR